VVANRTPTNQTPGPSWTDQQNQQHSDDRDRGVSQVFGPGVLCPIDNTLAREPVGHEEDVAHQQDESNQSQYNDFSNCQSHHTTLSKSDDQSAFRLALIWAGRKYFFEKILRIDVSGARGARYNTKRFSIILSILLKDVCPATKMYTRTGLAE
jgi:hypothetical protein